MSDTGGARDIGFASHKGAKHRGLLQPWGNSRGFLSRICHLQGEVAYLSNYAIIVIVIVISVDKI